MTSQASTLRATVQGDIGLGDPLYIESFETGTGGWQGNTAFGTQDLPSAIVQSNLKADDGTYSLRTTWATTTDAKPQWVGYQMSTASPAFWTPGQTYTMVARIFVPSGSGTVRGNYIFKATGDAVTVFDQWITYAFTFTADANAGTSFIGFDNIAPVGGTDFYVDKVYVYEGTATDYKKTFHAGDPCMVLVDGADTPVTANGLQGYTPTPGDRLLVSKVGGQVEILQYLSRSNHTDGFPPATSPAPKVDGGPTNLAVSWSAITNADPVTYEVHVSDAAFTAKAGDPTTLAGKSVGGSVFYVYTLPRTGAALAYSTTYYVQVVATDGDGSATPSASVTAQLSANTIATALTLNGAIKPPSVAPTLTQSGDPSPIGYANDPNWPFWGLGDTGDGNWRVIRHQPNGGGSNWLVEVWTINKTSGSVANVGSIALWDVNNSAFTSFHCDSAKWALMQDGGNGWFYLTWGTPSEWSNASNTHHAGWSTTADWYYPGVYHDPAGYIYVAAVSKHDGKLYVYRYSDVDLSGGVLVMTSTTVIADTTNDRTVRGLYVGNADYGALRYIVATQAGTYSFDSAGVYQSAEVSPIVGNVLIGLHWDGTNFHTNDWDHVIRKQSTLTKGWTMTGTFTWHKITPGTESTPSPSASLGLWARRWYSVSTSQIPQSSDPDAPDSVRVYLSTLTDTVPNRQADLSAGVTTITNAQSVTASGTHAPTTDGFAGLGGGGAILSEGTDGTNPLISLNGDGSGRVGPWAWDSTGDSTSHSRCGNLYAAGPWSASAPPNGTTGTAFTISKEGYYRLMAEATAYVGAGGNYSMILFIDGVQVSSRTFYFNQVSTHATVPRQSWVAHMTAGTHYFYIQFGGSSDNMDNTLLTWDPV